MLIAEELESISKSFDESLRSRLWGLSPASVSLPWLSSAVSVITFAHSAVRSLIYELKLEDGNSLSSWYSHDSLKVLDIFYCISAEIDRLFLRQLKLRIAMRFLCDTPSEEKIHEARDLLAGWESEGGGRHVNSGGGTKGLIRDLDAIIGMAAQLGKVSPVERVVSHTIRTVGFLTAFVARIVLSALSSSLRSVVCVSIPQEFPWGDAVRAIESAIIIEPRSCNEADGNVSVLKELDEVEASMKELYDIDARVRDVLETIEDVGAAGGGGDRTRMLREAVSGLWQAAEALSDGLSLLTEEVKEMLQMVMRMRQEMIDVFGHNVWK